MTTVDQDSVAQQSRGPAAGPPRRPAPWLSASMRVGISLFVAGAITTAAILAQWGPLHATTDVIGYPIFADFNPYNYSRAYFLVVGLFPVAALLIFLGLTRIGYRVGLPAPPSRGRLRPVAGTHEAASPDAEPSSRAFSVVAAAGRVAFVGAVLGLEVGIASIHPWRSVLLVAIGYSLVVGFGSVALRRVASANSAWKVSVSTVNSVGAALTVAGLVLVSAHTEVQILSGNTIHRYPWLPAWLGALLSAALLGWILVSLRRGHTSASTIERRTVLLVAAPVALFLLVAHLPGDLGQLGLFEEGQSVAETMLVGHGWLPWRDVVLTHGLLFDVAPTATGWAVFGHSYWGAIAGLTIFFLPLEILATYFLLVYLVGRSWPMLVVAALIFVGTWLGASDPRFLLWPVVLLLLAATLKRYTWTRAVTLGVLVVAQAIVTPEMAPAVLIVLAVLAAYEWYWRPPGAPWAQSWQRTIRMAVAVAVSGGAFLIYMASRGALDDVVYVTFNLVVGHTLDGAIPPQTTQSAVSEAKFDFVALAPVAALLVSFAYAVVRLRLRRPFLLADWPMAAAALFLLFYYTKFLARMDLPHAYQPFVVAIPLMAYIVYRAVSAMDQLLRSWPSRKPPSWMPTRPAAVVVLVFFLVSFWGRLHTVVDAAPAAYRPVSPVPPAFASIGYSSQVDGAALDDLQQIVDAYVGPHDRLLDITDEPALFYYYLGRGPSSRWYAPNGIVDTAELQRDLLGEVRRAPPKLIIFDDTDTRMYGLPIMDGVPVSVRLYLISRWILQHYRPLLESHGRTIYALPGVRPVSSLHLRLHEQPATVGVPFLGQECNWGDAPAFLGQPAAPGSGAQAVPVSTTSVHGPQVVFSGWAGDLRSKQPAREVLATINGRIIARSTPDTDRPDVPATGYPAGFLHSGFRLSIPTWAHVSKALRVFVVGRDGSIGAIPILNAPREAGTVRIGGRTVALQPSADTGWVDALSSSGSVLQIKPPADSSWRDYRWLEVDLSGSGRSVQGPVSLSDRAAAPAPGHVISFTTLDHSSGRYIIPVSSCQQWSGYGSSRLFLTPSVGQQIAGVRLIK